MKLLVIGLDGMSPELLEKLVKDGVFVNIGKLMKNYGKLKSTFPPVTGPAWTSFATGVNPGKHGVFDFAIPFERLNNIKALNSKDIRVKTFYEILEENDKKFVLVNLPFSWPPLTKQPTITSLMTNGSFIFPPNLVNIAPSLKNYRIVPKTFGKGQIKDIRELEKIRFDSAIELMKDEDFFFILFSGTDWVNHTDYDKLIDGTASSEVVALLKDIDSYVGQLCEKAENYIIISDHGFKTVNKIFLMNSWLEREKYLKRSLNKIKKEEHLFEKERQKELKPNRVGISKKTKAYMATHESQGIYINDNVENYEELRDAIIQGLDKEGVFSNIWKKEEKFGKVDNAPDILVEMKDGFIGTHFNSDIQKNGKMNIHDDYGIIISNKKVSDSAIIDLAPTILAFFNIGIPENMEGKVLFGEGEKVEAEKVEREKEEGEEEALKRLQSLGYID